MAVGTARGAGHQALVPAGPGEVGEGLTYPPPAQQPTGDDRRSFIVAETPATIGCEAGIVEHVEMDFTQLQTDDAFRGPGEGQRVGLQGVGDDLVQHHRGGAGSEDDDAGRIGVVRQVARPQAIDKAGGDRIEVLVGERRQQTTPDAPRGLHAQAEVLLELAGSGDLAANHLDLPAVAPHGDFHGEAHAAPIDRLLELSLGALDLGHSQWRPATDPDLRRRSDRTGGAGDAVAAGCERVSRDRVGGGQTAGAGLDPAHGKALLSPQAKPIVCASGQQLDRLQTLEEGLRVLTRVYGKPRQSVGQRADVRCE